MAKRKIKSESINEEILACKLCSNTLKNHRMLNCLHTFCLECLEDLIKENEKLICPTCSKSSLVPESGLDTLKQNTFLNNSLEINEKFGSSNLICCCGKTDVESYCQSCRHCLCSACSRYHKLLPVLVNHTLHSADDILLMSPTEIASIHPPLCLVHSKPLEFYCSDCKHPICVNCIIKGHSKCEEKPQPTTISTAFEKLQETSEELDKVVETSANNLQLCLDSVVESLQRLDQCRDNILDGIDNYVQEMIAALERNADRLRKEVESIYEKKRNTCDLQKNELSTRISEINLQRRNLKQLFSCDPATAVDSSERIIKSVQQCLKNLPVLEINDTGEIYFCKNKETIKILNEISIGDLTQNKFKVSDCLALQGGEPVTQGQMILVKVIQTNGEYKIEETQIRAVLTYPTGEETFADIKKSEGGFLVSAVSTTTGVCRLNVLADETSIQETPMLINVEKEGLVSSFQVSRGFVRDVVSSKFNSLLISRRSCELHEYKVTGEFVGKVALPLGMQVNRMYKMANGDIAFSDYGRNVKVVDVTGHISKTIGQGVLKNPYGIQIDESRNLLYVADGNSGCVFVFDMDTDKLISRIGSSGDGEGQLRIVRDVALTKTGNILVLEKVNNHMLQLFDKEGNFIKGLIRKGEVGQVWYPRAIVVDRDENIIISSCHKVQMFDRNGEFIKRIDKPEDGIKDPFGLSIISYNPRKIAVTNDGDTSVKIFNY